MLDWVAGAVESTKAALGITKAMVTLRDEGMIQERVFELNSVLAGLQQQLLQGQMEQMQLLDELREAKQALNELKEASKQNDKYERHKFAHGGFAYRLKAELKEGLEFYLCSNCFESGKHMTLHRERNRYVCPSCKVSVIHG